MDNDFSGLLPLSSKTIWLVICCKKCYIIFTAITGRLTREEDPMAKDKKKKKKDKKKDKK